MKIYNTLAREKQEFIPLEEGKVSIYTCGPTVYNYFHIGNARPFITFDTLRRYLEFRGYNVTFVQNFTDIDDKMIFQANAEGITVRELADRFIAEYYVDADHLNIERSSFQPRATDCIEDIVAMIDVLVQKGYAYEAEDGVYFSVEKFETYGRLSNYNLDELEAGASDRVSLNDVKKNRADFALWKFKKEGEPAWPSPWGEGRPGWHIECSAMSRKYLGDTIDIHCGGKDLIFPHHENEIAQSEAATGKPFVRYWMHNGFININNEKMSKSTGNFFTIRDIVKKYPYDVIRFFILSSHYRSPINFSDELLEAAENGLGRIRNCINSLTFVADSRSKNGTEPGNTEGEAQESLKQSIQTAKTDFIQSMDDDLNTADAIASIFNLVRDANIAAGKENIQAGSLLEAKAAIMELCSVLGIRTEIQNNIPQEVTDLVEKRSEAKKQRNFALADEIRGQITALGYSVSDTPSGPKIAKI